MTSTIYDIPVQRLDGTPSSLRDFAGSVVLVVNVASACGFTPQYTALESLYEAERARGLVIAAFPSNDFGAQEPGSSAEIAEFCSSKFHVTFPMFEKIAVSGPGKHPLYAMLTSATPKVGADHAGLRQQLIGYGMTPTADPEVLWNFEKFVIGRDGTVVARFASDVTPDDPRLRAAIDEALAA